MFLVNRAFVPGFDENGENEELPFHPVEQGFAAACSSDPVRTTKMAGVRRAKAWFTKNMVFVP